MFRVLISMILIASSSQGYSDEVSRIKDMFRKHYDETIPQYKRLVTGSEQAAEKYIEGIFDSNNLRILGDIEQTAIFLEGPTLETVSCINDQALLGQEIDNYMERESQATGDLREWRRRNYNSSDYLLMAQRIHSIQENYKACVDKIQKTRGGVRALNYLKTRNIDLCGAPKEQIVYDKFLREVSFPSNRDRVKFDPNMFARWPGIVLGVQKHFDCDGTNQSCDLITLDAEKTRQEQADDYARFRARYPEFSSIALSYVLTNKAAMKFFGTEAMTSLEAGPYVAAAYAVAVLVKSFYQNYEARLKVDNLNDFIRDKEKEIDEILSRFISEEQFLNKTSAMCGDKSLELKSDIRSTLETFQTRETLDAIELYFSRSKGYASWYNSLFLDSLKGTPRLIDINTEQQLKVLKEQFYSDIYAARAKQTIADIERTIDEKSSNISLQSCSGSKNRVRRSVRRLVRSFVMECETRMNSFFKQASVNAGDVETNIRYVGLNPEARKIRVRNGAGFSSDIQLLSSNDTILEVIKGVASNKIFSADLLVEAGGVDFGTSSHNRLEDGVYNLSFNTELTGIDATLSESVVNKLYQSNKTVRRKIVRCMRQIDHNYTLDHRVMSCQIPLGGL